MSRGALASAVHNQQGELQRPTISVVLPTFNEAANIPILINRVREALDGHAYEVIIVDDDSPDRTWAVAQELAEADHRITVIRRKVERGLSSAVLSGMAAARGNVLVAMDADLQHDECRIHELAAAVTDGGADVCLGSRDADGGGYGDFRRRRRLASWAGASLAKLVLQVPVSDPMSGFFAVGRDRYELIEGQVNPRGFKILLEFLARGPKPTVAEVGYVFGERVNGTTKLTGTVVVEYLRALASLCRAARRDR
ncbi:MAG: polyprenol monophosphomannose synthase [Actinomycetota bacterium]